jgi:hypothetical protein
MLYLSSDFSLCNTKVNQTINGTISSISLSDSQKIGISIACFGVIFGYLCYKGFQQHQKYTDVVLCKHKLEEYNTLNLKIRDADLITKRKSEQVVLIYNENIGSIKNSAVYMVEGLGNLAETTAKVKQLFLNKLLIRKYKILKNLNPTLPDIDLNITKRHNLMEAKVSLVLDKLYKLVIKSNKPFKSDFKTLKNKEDLIAIELLSLGNVYTNILPDLLNKPQNTKEYDDKIVNMVIEIDRSINELLKLTNEILPILKRSGRGYTSIEAQIMENPGIILESVSKNICNSYYYSLGGYFPSISFFFVNLSYTISYPTFYILNKTVGVHNPFNYSVFKESVWYFITFKMFF